MVVCGSCGQEVEEESTHCPSCGGLVSTLPLALDFAWRYESMARSERAGEWRNLAQHEKEEAERLLGGSVDIPVSRGRRVALLVLVLLAAALGVGLLARAGTGGAVALADSPLAAQAATTPPPLLRPLSPSERIPAVCEDGLVLPEVVVVREPTVMYAAPLTTSETIVRLEQNTLLRVRCRGSEWAKLEVQQPPRLRGSLGWVPVDLLARPPEARAQLVRRIGSALVLDEEIRRYRSEVVEALVGIITEVPRCGLLDLGSLAMSESRGGAPEFSVVCDPGENGFNYWFDLEGRESRRAKPLEVAGDSNVERCRSAVVGSASVPESVSFDTSGAVEVESPPGVSRLVTTATAADRQGRSRDYRVLCVFEGQALMNWAIAD